MTGTVEIALAGAPSALDEIADKIAAADHMAAPELGTDVVIRPASAPQAAPQ